MRREKISEEEMREIEKIYEELKEGKREFVRGEELLKELAGGEENER